MKLKCFKPVDSDYFSYEIYDDCDSLIFEVFRSEEGLSNIYFHTNIIKREFLLADLADLILVFINKVQEREGFDISTMTLFKDWANLKKA